MSRVLRILLVLLAIPSAALAHHGVASLGVAGVEGPGAPIETSTSATLPPRSVFGYLKLDYAKFELLTAERDDETNFNAYWMYGLGYGIASYLSGYIFLPYYSKVLEDNSYNTSGFADMAVNLVLGFKYDAGFRLTPANESLDDLEDWHFTIYAGSTLPTGDANIRDSQGEIDPGMSLGFGKPAWTLGATTTRMLGSRWTFVMEASHITFGQYQYDDGTRFRFGNELRVNTAFPVRLVTLTEPLLRLDLNLEADYLSLGRDELEGVGEEATGGKILYALPGFRLYYKNVSAALGVKLPAWTELNEEDLQQGAEGKESWRLICTFSTLL